MRKTFAQLVSFDSLLLLVNIEKYLPYMTEEELLYILVNGRIPSQESLSRWILEEASKVSKWNALFDEAYKVQREKTAKKPQTHRKRI